MNRITVAIANTFEEFDPAGVTPSTRLGDIPGWDSMASVNLQLELESAFEVSFDETVLSGEHTIRDVIEMLAARGVTVAAGGDC